MRGRVLGVGGLKEKALAALRHGIKTVIMPKENVKDLEEISKEQRKQLTFIPVTDVSEVLEHALLPKEPVARKGHKRKTKKRLQPTRRV